MPTPHSPRPAYPPPGGDPGESDDSLAAPLRAGSDAEASRSAALLMARHWQPAHDYAVICLATPGPLAHMVTGAAFHQILDRLALGEPAEALRPRLLGAVRDTAANWAATERVAAALPGLENPAGGRGMSTAKSLIPENRALAEHSFRNLPLLGQALLWHTEVDAEPVSVPAALLGLDTDSAAAAREEARDRFREGCVRAHRELAPSNDCRHYNRLLDVPIRRGGDLLPDVREHLAACPYCRHAADQLGRIDAALGLLLAEAVLGWGARRYVDSRPGRTRPSAAGSRGAAGRSGGRRRGGGGTGLPGLLSRGSASGGRRREEGGAGTPAGGTEPGRRRRGGDSGGLDRAFTPDRRVSGAGPSSRTLLTGFGVASVGLLATVLAVSVWPQGGAHADPVTATGATPGGGVASSPAAASGTDARSPVADTPGTASGPAGLPSAGRATRLHNSAAAGLCLDVKGTPEAGAGVLLAACSSAGTQQWMYDADGLLHSMVDSGLCLDSRADAAVVILGTCADIGTARGDDVRYDLTVQGELLPRWDPTLALAATGTRPGADIVVTARDRSPDQRWQADTPSAGSGSLSVVGGDGRSARPAEADQGA
ncbi:RICIN domain-containing protein [Streptomyces sp. NBC_00820]|uniref:RICIN domain-containing protein n=1 Tax=Streptomyces sp. NBC_00820 TaxID=2975842 RepID=UPI002ED40C21|nr:RICIN domain-containing protein [Streptomyces sp. NBC_00820]